VYWSGLVLLDSYVKSRPFVSVDSRLIMPGTLFFALKGAKSDGHDFLKQASEGGAEAAVVEESYRGPAFGLKLHHVQDTLKALQTLAGQVQKSRKAKIIGITGSVGKTTTKEFLYQLLKGTFKAGKSPGNMNSQIGLPLALLNELKGDEDYAVLEMAMTHPGQISSLVEIAPPDYAMVTSVQLVHAANFDSLQEIAEAKGEIFSSPETLEGFYFQGLEVYPGIVSKGLFPKTPFKFTGQYGTPSIPPHLLDNFEGAAVIAHKLGVPLEVIRNTKIELYESRFEISEKKGITFVNDAYNASEAAIIAGLKSLPKAQGKKIAVIGEMLELGKFHEECHLRVGEALKAHVDELILVGEGTKPIADLWGSGWNPSYKEALHRLRETALTGDLVYLKGSKFWQLWKIAGEF
jgi:UDP-N-acetylmuramoyl-tripeptide--D-alanyl-D-alanine ligase